MSFRPNYSAGWRQREVEKAKARKEADQKLAEEVRMKSLAKTDTNFPGLPTGNPLSPPPAPAVQRAAGESFADMAHVWRISDDLERARIQRNQIQAEQSRNEFAGFVAMPRFRPGRLQNMRYDSSSEEEDPIHRIQPGEDDGWNEVKRKAHKGPRELSEAEMQRRCNASSSEDEDGGDHNGHLFESYRHDHH